MSYIFMLMILSLLILVHEAGHFVCARLVGVPVARFSLGFGPAIWKRTLSGTEYRWSAIPLGGYVLLDLKDENEYLSLPLSGRLVFTLGGPLANLILAWPLYALANVLNAGFSVESLLTVPLVQIGAMVTAIGTALAGLFHHSGQLMGMVGLVVEGGRQLGPDLVKGLAMAAALSLNLAICNLLPLPPLDGGKMVLDVLHRVRKDLDRLYVPAMVGGWLLVAGLTVALILVGGGGRARSRAGTGALSGGDHACGR